MFAHVRVNLTLKIQVFVCIFMFDTELESCSAASKRHNSVFLLATY